MAIQNATAVAKNVDIKAESLKIALGILVLFASSQIAIPLEPVPITLQTVGVMLIGLLYSRRAGLWSVVLYTIFGGMGLPMFQGFAGGLDHLYGSTAGYIVGFTASVYVMIMLREKFGFESFWGMLANCTIGTLIVFIFGVSWLAVAIGWKDAFTFGVIPFIIPGAMKAFLLCGALRFIRGNNIFARG